MECIRLARSGDPLPGAASERPCYRIPALAVTGTGRVVVKLSGFAKSQAEKDRAGQLAREVKGVTEVRNSLVVKQ